MDSSIVIPLIIIGIVILIVISLGTMKMRKDDADNTINAARRLQDTDNAQNSSDGETDE